MKPEAWEEKKINDRRGAREVLMTVAFQMEAQGDDSEVVMERLLSERRFGSGQEEYVRKTFATLRQHVSEIDALIDEHAHRWRTARLPKAELAILRLAVCEMKYCEDIPISVSINEAVELAKKYGEEQGTSFVNGVLGNIARTMETQNP